VVLFILLSGKHPLNGNVAEPGIGEYHHFMSNSHSTHFTYPDHIKITNKNNLLNDKDFKDLFIRMIHEDPD